MYLNSSHLNCVVLLKWSCNVNRKCQWESGCGLNKHRSFTEPTEGEGGSQSCRDVFRVDFSCEHTQTLSHMNWVSVSAETCLIPTTTPTSSLSLSNLQPQSSGSAHMKDLFYLQHMFSLWHLNVRQFNMLTDVSLTDYYLLIITLMLLQRSGTLTWGSLSCSRSGGV